MDRNMSLESNGVDRERSLWKFLRHRGTNFCINCTSLAHFASSLCSSIMVPNAPKQKETNQNMTLGSNGVDRERSFQKILTRHRCTNFCINCTCLARFAPSFMQKETHQNMSLDSNVVDRERLLWKFLTTHRGTNFCINCTSLACFCRKFCAIAKRFQMHPNGKKHTKTWV